ncbi:hypothetical protein GYB22_08575 [bacterium]|nr:hypothetical protein [bacterium]
MQLTSNFGLGLAIGISLSFGIVFLSSSIPATDSITEESAINNEVKGEFIEASAANELISSYSTNWVEANKLPPNTTIGGYIGKANLSQVASNQNGEEYIKFRFYYTENAAGDPQIGLIFYPSENSSTVLRTGAASFCPSVCNTPE